MDRLVDIRITDAIENIARIEQALTRVRERRKSAEDLVEGLTTLTDPATVRTPLDSLIAQAQFQLRVASTIAYQAKPLKPIAENIVKEAGDAVDKLQKSLYELQAKAGPLSLYRFRPDQLKRHEVKTREFLEHRSDLLTALRSGPHKPDEANGQLLQNIEAHKPLWGEHIETVAGLLLRDEEFDQGLSVLSDAVVHLCTSLEPGFVQDTLTVLGRDKAGIQDLRHTIYFRFPGWTVWGLALIAHDVWHVSRQGGPIFQRKLIDLFKAFPHLSLERIWKVPLVQECLADTFATYVMGPSYAFACILLHLDINSPNDRLRAEAIFRALRFLDETPDGDCCILAHDLDGYWSRSCARNANEDPIRFHCMLGRECALVDELLHARSSGQDTNLVVCPCAQADPTCPMTNFELLEVTETALLECLKGTFSKLEYSPDVLDGVENEPTAPEQLLRQEAEPSEEQKQACVAGLDLRHLLSAAWTARWEGTLGGHQPKDLEYRLRELCLTSLVTKVLPNIMGHDKYGQTTI